MYMYVFVYMYMFSLLFSFFFFLLLNYCGLLFYALTNLYLFKFCVW